jgi:hypothetical protein
MLLRLSLAQQLNGRFLAGISICSTSASGRVRTVERVGRAIRADGLASVQRNSAAVRAREGWSGMCFLRGVQNRARRMRRAGCPAAGRDGDRNRLVGGCNRSLSGESIAPLDLGRVALTENVHPLRNFVTDEPTAGGQLLLDSNGSGATARVRLSPENGAASRDRGRRVAALVARC